MAWFFLTMCFVYLSVSPFTCLLPRNHQDFCPSLAPIYQGQSLSRCLVSECSLQNPEVPTEGAMGEGHPGGEGSIFIESGIPKHLGVDKEQ